MPGLNDLRAQVQPMTGPASVDAAIAALNPQEQAMLAAGIDPFGVDQGMMGGQPGVAQGTPQQAASPGLTPEARLAIGQALSQTLAAIGQPTNEADAVAVQSIQNALTALAGGQ